MTYGNLLKNILATETTTGGITFTPNNIDGTITINGSDEEDRSVPITDVIRFPIDVKISGAPIDESTDTYYYGGYNIGYASNETIIPAGRQFQIRVAVRKNVQCENIVFRPMIRPAYINDSTYNPCALNLQKLTAFVNWIDAGKFDLYHTSSEGNVPDVNFKIVPLPENTQEILIHIGFSNGTVQVYGGNSMYIIDRGHPYVWNCTGDRVRANESDWRVYAYWAWFDGTQPGGYEGFGLRCALIVNYCGASTKWHIWYKIKL